jgi:hypothetical protein
MKTFFAEIFSVFSDHVNPFRGKVSGRKLDVQRFMVSESYAIGQNSVKRFYSEKKVFPKANVCDFL